MFLCTAIASLRIQEGALLFQLKKKQFRSDDIDLGDLIVSDAISTRDFANIVASLGGIGVSWLDLPLPIAYAVESLLER